MANPKELRAYRRRAEEAVALADAVERLPRRVGDRVKWLNGVVWERTGDDRWTAMPEATFIVSSGHVAQFDWTTVKKEET